MKLHETILETLEEQLDISVVKHSFNFLMDAINEKILDANSDEERVALLYAVKIICLTYGIKKPNWWYKRRKNTDWLDEEGDHHYGYDLSAF